MNLHEALKVVKLRVETSTVKPYNGICASLGQLGLDTYGSAADATTAHEFEDLCKRWSKYSGTEAYPVPSPDSARTDEQMFDYALGKDIMWEGEYAPCVWNCLTS